MIRNFWKCTCRDRRHVPSTLTSDSSFKLWMMGGLTKTVAPTMTEPYLYDSYSNCTDFSEPDSNFGCEMYCRCHIQDYSYEYCDPDRLVDCAYDIVQFIMVVPRMHRCRRLIMKLDSFDSAANFFVLLDDICVPRLEEFIIDIVACSK